MYVRVIRESGHALQRQSRVTVGCTRVNQRLPYYHYALFIQGDQNDMRFSIFTIANFLCHYANICNPRHLNTFGSIYLIYSRI